MSDAWKRTVISRPGAAIRMERLEPPDYVTAAIAEAIERGKRDARRFVREYDLAPSFGRWLIGRLK